MLLGEPHAVTPGTAGSLFELPLLPAHGTLLLHLLGVEPLQDAVHVETVGALPPYQRAIVSRHLTVGAAPIERHTADPTVFIVGHPQPGSHSVPGFDLHFHILSFGSSESMI